jgi:hypothetical protein
MKYIFVDTNNFIACALIIKKNHSPETVKKLCELLDKNEINLILPEIVEIEFYRVLDKELIRIKNLVEEFKKYVVNFGGVLNENVASYLGIEKDKFIKSADSIYKKRQISSGVAKNRIRTIFESKNTSRIVVTSEIFINAYKRALSGRKPYTFKYCPECKELKKLINADCLIFESIVTKIKELGPYELIFCSDDRNAFSTYDDNIRKDIFIPELNTELGGKIKYYRNLGDALDSEFRTDIRQDEKKKIERSLEYLRISPILESISNLTLASSIGEQLKNLTFPSDALKNLEQALKTSVSGIASLKLKSVLEEEAKSATLMSEYFKKQLGGIGAELSKSSNAFLEALKKVGSLSQIDKVKQEDDDKNTSKNNK